MTGLFSKAISKSNLWRLIPFTLLFLACCFGFYKNFGYMQGLLIGPEVVSGSYFSTVDISEEGGAPYISFETNDLIDTGYQEITEVTRRRSNSVVSSRVSGNIMMAPLLNDTKALLINVDVDNETETYTGFLKPYNSMMKDIHADLIQEVPESEKALLPYFLDDTDEPNWLFPGIGIALMLFSLFKIMTTLLWIQSPEKHPINRRLASYGNSNEVAADIEMELGQARQINKKIYITKNWLVYISGETVLFERLENIVWVYTHVVTKRIYYIIPVGKKYAVHVMSRTGVMLKIPTSGKDADELITAIREVNPKVIIGFSSDLETLWEDDPTLESAAIENREIYAE